MTSGMTSHHMRRTRFYKFRSTQTLIFYSFCKGGKNNLKSLAIITAGRAFLKFRIQGPFEFIANPPIDFPLGKHKVFGFGQFAVRKNGSEILFKHRGSLQKRKRNIRHILKYRKIKTQCTAIDIDMFNTNYQN